MQHARSEDAMNKEGGIMKIVDRSFASVCVCVCVCACTNISMDQILGLLHVNHTQMVSTKSLK
jgi:hypothetical protein